MRFVGSVMIGIVMLGRAALAFVVLDIADAQHAILLIAVFYIMMFNALWLNVAVLCAFRYLKLSYYRDLSDGAE